MPTDPSITDWIEAIGTAATAVISLFLLFQIYVARQQLQLSREQTDKDVTWNKLNATFVFLDGDRFDAKERTVAEKLEPLGVNLLHTTTAISLELVERIRNDLELYAAVKSFLNLFEDYATAIRVGILDPDCAYAIISGQVIRYGDVMMSLVKREREITDDDEFYIEFEKLYLEWKARFEQQREASRIELERVRNEAERQIADAQREVKQRKGVVPRY